MDHPGVYENAKYGYLHETLISRQGIPAVLAILLEQVCQQLLTAGAIDFAVRVDCSALDRCMAILCSAHGSEICMHIILQMPRLRLWSSDPVMHSCVEMLPSHQSHDPSTTIWVYTKEHLCVCLLRHLSLPVSSSIIVIGRMLDEHLAAVQATNSGCTAWPEQRHGHESRRHCAEHMLHRRADRDAALP